DAEEFILGRVEDGEARLKREVHGLYKAFSLAMPQPDALKIREEVAFFQAVKARLTKSGETGKFDKDYKRHQKRGTRKYRLKLKVRNLR
ncbi:MAG: DUF3387 domain-containing protein, partial [Puniceicoccales bacterium]|nr:DUF3387 domain-containing protein [Puniceicoccales bacterium]